MTEALIKKRRKQSRKKIMERKRLLKQKAQQIAASDGYGEEATSPSIAYPVKRVGIWWIIVLAVFLLYGVISSYSGVVGVFFPESQSQVAGNLAGLTAEELRVKLEAQASSSVREQFALLGDAMGGLLNPLLSFVGLVLLIVTLRQNHKALRDNADELRLSRLEFELTRQELANSSKAQEEIEKTQRIQRLENTLYHLVEMNKSLYDQNSNAFEHCYVSAREQMDTSDLSGGVEMTERNSSDVYLFVNSLNAILDFIYSHEELHGHEKYILIQFPTMLLGSLVYLGPAMKSHGLSAVLRVIQDSGAFQGLRLETFRSPEEKGFNNQYAENFINIYEAFGAQAFGRSVEIAGYYNKCKEHLKRHA